MALYQGNNEIGAVFHGNSEIETIYQGNTEIWANTKVFDLGTATSFNVANVYNKYSELTVDNFFLTATTGGGASCTASGNPSATGTCYTAWVSTSKSYNASTGVLNFSYGGASVHAWLVVDTSVLTFIGNSGGNATSMEDYQNMTVNNFFVRSIPSTRDVMDYCYGSNSCPAIVYSPSKGYNTSNGVISWYVGRYRQGNVSVTDIYAYNGKTK